MQTLRTAALMLLTALMATSCFFGGTNLDYDVAIVGQWQEYKEVYYDVNPPETIYLDEIRNGEYYVYTFYSNGEAVLEAIEKGGSYHKIERVSYQVSGASLYIGGHDYNYIYSIRKLNSSELVIRMDDGNLDAYFRRVG